MKEDECYSLIPVRSLSPTTFSFRVVKKHGIRSEGIDVHMRCLSNIFFLLLWFPNIHKERAPSKFDWAGAYSLCFRKQTLHLLKKKKRQKRQRQLWPQHCFKQSSHAWKPSLQCCLVKVCMNCLNTCISIKTNVKETVRLYTPHKTKGNIGC